MEHNFVRAMELKNNLKLKIYDNSKKMAGDRWLVSLIARIKVPVDATSKLLSDSDIGNEEITELLGSEVLFEQKRERFFIDEKNKESVFNELCDNFVRNTISYLSLPDFPKKFVIMKLKEKKKNVLLQATADRYRSE
ncbi:MAG: hypothetical protein KKE00_08305 [Proteobacteria bacterium]|nr:hypothetical protein [Pseudomonadota bacterium]MBU1570503.1 hypothetical protein [Pseudomonadota bacterium]